MAELRIIFEFRRHELPLTNASGAWGLAHTPAETAAYQQHLEHEQAIYAALVARPAVLRP